MIPALFESMPSTNHLGLLGPGAPDFKKTTTFLALKKDEVAAATGVPRESIRFDQRIPEDLRQRLIEIATICELVAGFFKGDVEKTALWFRVPNPMLGNLSPRDMIRLGRYKKLHRFVDDAMKANRRAEAK